MRRLALALATIVLVLSAMAGTSAQKQPRVVDLGHPLTEDSPSWTGEKVYVRTGTGDAARDGIAMAKIATDEHFGTHLDAPAHFSATGWTTEKIPVERLLRPAVCLNVAAQAEHDENYRVTVQDVQTWEREHGTIPGDSLVLVATGWDARWAQPRRYMNERNGVKHFPGLSVAAAKLLVERGVAGIAIDSPSVDYGPSEKYEVHRTTMPRNIYHVENATGLTKLPPGGFTVIVAPINIAGGSGGPTRIFALLN
ncbi:MAG: cyclase family protein [Acidobacteria bacterium]|nr:cyclase family protein [Acidobacteriota bacterium]